MPSSVASPDQVYDVIQRTLREILGDTVTTFLLGKLERRHDVESSEIVGRPDVLSSLLREFFGGGGEVLERVIVLRLSERFSPEIRSRTFLEAVAELVGVQLDPG